MLTLTTFGQIPTPFVTDVTSQHQRHATNKRKILIVDDLDDARWVLAKIVETAGFHPLLASNGEEALRLIRDEAPDLVLLDARLLDMDGFEVLARLKSQEKSIPVIMITAYSQTYDATQAIRAGAYDFVTKPFNNKDIALTIHVERLRSNKPFIVVDCGAIPATLIESELLSYEKGAFTGATHGKAGALELAAGGAILVSIFDLDAPSHGNKTENTQGVTSGTECHLLSGLSSCLLSSIHLKITPLRGIPLKDLVRDATTQIERLALVRALELTQGNKAKAVRLLRVYYKTIQSKLNSYHITHERTAPRRDATRRAL